MLNKRLKFKSDLDDFIQNPKWDLSTARETSQLRDRLALHSSKISSTQHFLQDRLLPVLRDDMSVTHQTSLHAPGNTEGNLIANAQKVDIRSTKSSTEVEHVPEYLGTRFAHALEAGNPKYREERNFPFYDGIDAVHRHFNGNDTLIKIMMEKSASSISFAGRTSQLMQCLNSFKCLWIIQKIRKGSEWAEASKSHLSRSYIHELEAKCLQEISYFTSNKEPRDKHAISIRADIDLLPRDEFRVLLHGNDGEDEDEDLAATGIQNEILRVPLMDPSENRRAELVLIRQSKTRLQMQLSSVNIAEGCNREIIRERLEINLEEVYFVPLYANPGSMPVALDIKFRGDQGPGEGKKYSFLELKDLLEFQQVITGYRTVFQEFKVEIYQTSGLFKRTQLDESGRIQTWSPKSPDKHGLSSGISGAGSSDHPLSLMSYSPTALSSEGAYSTAPTSPFDDKKSNVNILQQPDLPMIVLYLRSLKKGKVAMTILLLQSTDPFTYDLHSFKD